MAEEAGTLIVRDLLVRGVEVDGIGFFCFAFDLLFLVSSSVDSASRSSSRCSLSRCLISRLFLSLNFACSSSSASLSISSACFNSSWARLRCSRARRIELSPRPPLGSPAWATEDDDEAYEPGRLR